MGVYGATKSIFQSTRPVWGATTVDAIKMREWRISIHAPRVGRDLLGAKRLARKCEISIHAPRVGRDLRRVD